MNASPLPERDRRADEDAFNKSQRDQPNKLIERAVVAALAGVGIASVAIEYAISYRVFVEWFAPDVPGEPMHGPVGLMACSTVIASAAFHLYLAKHPDALAGKLLNRSVPYLALTFVGSMALMAARSVLAASDIAIFGAASMPDLFADDFAAPQSSLFDRIAIGFFCAGLASLALANFWMCQRVADLIWQRLKPMCERAAAAKETKLLMEAIDADEALLSQLGAKKQMLFRELQPPASLAFAAELSALVQKLRGPMVAVITGDVIWKKRKDSVLERRDEPELDIAKYKELVTALDLTPEQIFSAFNSTPEGKRK